MSSMPAGTDRSACRRDTVKASVSKLRHVGGFILRAIFIVALMIVIARVSLPQSSSIWTVYDDPGDLVRLLLGIAACLWVGVQLFRTPKDPHSYGAWFYIGLAAVPFAVICVLGIW